MIFCVFIEVNIRRRTREGLKTQKPGRLETQNDNRIPNDKQLKQTFLRL